MPYPVLDGMAFVFAQELYLRKFKKGFNQISNLYGWCRFLEDALIALDHYFSICHTNYKF